jgi:large subunit ribosomal protein L7/L12
MDAVELKAIGDALANLTVAQASGLAGYLKETYRIEAAAGNVIVQRGTVDPTPKPVELPTTVDVVLTSAGDRRINVIKVVRQHTGLGLKEAKELVEGAPMVVKADLERAEAEKLRKELEDQGAGVELR